MTIKLRCPQCDRILRFPDEKDARECDGCRAKFDLKSLRYVPASLLKKVLGGGLIAFGIFWLLLSLSQLVPSPDAIGARRSVFYLLGLFALPLALIYWGGTFFKTKAVWDLPHD
jgi:hypothetical protein